MSCLCIAETPETAAVGGDSLRRVLRKHPAAFRYYSSICRETQFEFLVDMVVGVDVVVVVDAAEAASDLPNVSWAENFFV
jgi:hypothetical protein